MTTEGETQAARTPSAVSGEQGDEPRRDDIVLTQYDEYLGIVQGVDDDFKDATKCDSFKSVPVVEFVSPLPTVVEMIQNRIFLSGFTKDNWTDAHTEFITNEFITGNADIIFFQMRPNTGLRLDVGFPSHFSYDLNYFMRTNEAAGKELTPENFQTYVQYGSIIGQGIESLMRVMSTVYAPAFFANKDWPDSIKNDFALQLHRFMSALTDTRWKLKLKTVLYIPTEGMDQTVEEVSKDKDLVTRLELIVIHWTRQIKEVLTSQNMMDDMEGVGPLEEIDFWKNRCDDLMGISKQLDNEHIIHVSKVLTLAKSSYINAFIRLAEEIKNTSNEAMSNLKFLNTLKEMCTTLSDLPPAEIPPLLPRIINQIRMIWVNSDNYNTKEAITGLFRKVSNEIITRCCSVIKLEDIFQGRVRSASLKLQDCINCCENYKEIYEHIAEVHRKFSTFPWDATANSIFAQVDAFIQRCKDLMEICECQAHFGRYDEGKKAEMPIFQGARGPEVELLLNQIENMFAKLMANLSEKRSLILNVKATSWHDEYNRFRSGVKDLEIMMQNGINLAFETVTTIQQGVEVLDIFAHLQKREAIRRTLDANTHAVIQLFLDGIQKIKHEMSVRPYTGMPLPREPTYGIQGILWRFLRRRLEKSMQHLDQAFFLPTAAAALEEHRNSYTQLCLGLEELTRKVFNDFQQTVESDPLKCLEVPILIRNSLQPSKIEQTFHASVLKLINELDYWVRLGVETPHYAAEAQRRKPELRALNEMVLVLVREYNRIMNALNPEEKALFQERIKMLDKKIAPGFTKIQWPVKSMVEHFINDCRLHACRLQSKVDEYKAANANIKGNCELIARTLLIKLEPGRVYENNDFDEQQVSHRRTAATRLMEYHKEIVQRMREVKETFVSESPEIQAHWTKYTEKMDRYCEEAFRLNVKFSLGELQRAINGDGRNEPNPLFKILLTLDNDKLVFLPTMPALTSVVISLNGKIINVFSEVPRLPAILARPTTVKPPISEYVENDEEIMKIQANITRGITEISKAIHNPLAYWDQFREIWELPKDEIIRKYREFNPHVSSIDADIARYTEVTNKVLDAEAMVTVRFLQLDFSLLKNAIAAHCRDWQVRLTNLLMDMTVDSLNGIYDYMATMQEKLAQTPQTLEELVSGINLLEEVKKEQDDIQAKFVPLEEQFAILDKCEVTYTPEVTMRRANLAADWARFQEAISEAEQLIKKSKEKFKAALLSESDMLKRRIAQILQDLQTNGPFAAAIKPDEALETCKGYRDRLAAALEREAELRRGLMLFKIEQPPCKETILIERELETLETIWGLNKEFEEHWAMWKAGRFMELKTYEMETLANSTFKKFTKYSRELRDRNWEVVEFSRLRVDQFRRTLPLISDLRNEAMRPRHWAAIKREMGREFDETADDFTLEKIVDLGFDQYAGMINELSSAATKELAIEKALIKIDAQWEVIELDVVPHKDKGHFKIRSVDELTQTLEDHQVQLSTMKASRFVKPFEDLVDKWERALSKITEVSEMLLLVQRQWVYMETIFMGEDIRKQLPKESAQFDQINKQWKAIMTDINVMRNAKLCSEKPGLFEELTGMNVLLEEIEKSLDMYLETKRQLFPRFYFISNEDLLEILGQGRNPEAVLPHLKKCFDNINTLKLEKKITQEKVEPPPKAHTTKSHARKPAAPGQATPSDASTAPAAAPAEKPPEGAGQAAPPAQPPPPPPSQPAEPANEVPDAEATQSAAAEAAAASANEPAPEGEAEAAAAEATEVPDAASPAPPEAEAPAPEVVEAEAAPPPPDENVSNVMVDWNNSSAARVARRRQLRAMYFGSPHSANNVGAQVRTFEPVVKSAETEDNARLMRQLFFSEAHNVGDAPVAKKGVVNVVHFDAISMFSADGEEVPFKKRVRLEGPVESWLCEIEDQMRKTLRDLLRDIRPVMKKVSIRRERVIKEWSGQICLTCSQIQWTADVTRALMMVAQRHDKKPLRNMRKKQRAILKRLSESIRSNLTKMQRLKMNGLVVIEVHQRDIIERLYKVNCNDTTAFDWLAQLRFYWEKDEDDCFAKQTNTSFRYGYEYLGNSGRLVITPLTDRCYITLTTALSLNRGGSPKGPAGTGKTETTKDLGKSLGGYVIVINCSDGLDYKSMGRMFSGLAQTGAWGCFDEFNRINIEVLSVVAQQILAVLSALASMPKNQATPEDIRFMFEGRMIKLVWSCGIFITMNPGYAGRTELPDNLKSMFRPIAMVCPDSTMIAEITLFAEGFNNTKALAKKVFTLYSLSVQQLSKQDHYDFGLRALISVLRYAGRKKRANPSMQEEEVLLLSMNDMNLAKMTAADLPLFRGIVSDLFPNIEIPAIDYTKMKQAIIDICKESKLEPTKFTILKVIQLYETQSSRHSVMIVGKTLSGKSTTWRILQKVQAKMAAEKEPGYLRVFDYPLNPKSVSLGELYGEFNIASNEWTDGVLSSIMRTACADDRPEYKWIIFDGPVDALWIESMNSVMDDNKILTLINGERISMPDPVSLLFEVEDLAVASPATVSRAGMVYNDVQELGWWPYVNCWIATKTGKVVIDTLKMLFNKDLTKILEFVQRSCNKLIPVSEISLIIGLCRLFDGLFGDGSEFDNSDADNYARVIEMLFQFSLLWSVCCVVDEDGRKKVDSFVRELDGSFPNKDSIYEYFVDTKTRTWIHWEEKLRGGWKYQPSMPFFKILVPTVDTVRYKFLVNTLVAKFCPVLITGPVGTGKTSVAQDVLFSLDREAWSFLTINMSAQTSSNNVQDIIESRVEKRTKGTFVPIGGTKMLTFLDDFNMPAKDEFGSQPPLELIRQWIDYGFWYDRAKQVRKSIVGMFLLASMGPPGGGRMPISRRLQARFNQINITFPTDDTLKQIFGSMLTQKLLEFEDEVKNMADKLTLATIDLYKAIVAKFLPTPTKIHYLFNLRDISKIYQGLLRSDKVYHDTRTVMLRLWIHETFRVFSDRLINDKDRATFIEVLGDRLAAYFDQTFHNLCPSRCSPIFTDILSQDAIYEDAQDLDKLRDRFNSILEVYNSTPGMIRSDLVLFKDAMEHICKIMRVIGQPRGNMLLVGVGGSGRQSLSRLGAFICEYRTFQIEVTKHYKRADFREDLKKLYRQAGVQNQATCFLFSDTQVAEEAFLEDINNLLSSGEVPNLFKPDEFEDIRQSLLDIAKHEGVDEAPQVIRKFFIERVRANLHIVLCMSPIGDPFRNRLRMYPGFVNCTTIDWFSEWPMDALLEVATKYLQDVELLVGDEDRERASKKMKPGVARAFATMHGSVARMSERMLTEMRRHNYVTPTNYLELVSGYKKMLLSKRIKLSDQANKLKSGLGKIDETREKVQDMSVELEEARVKVAAFQKECDDYLVILVEQKREADEQAKSVTLTKEKIKVDEVKCLKMAEIAQADLAQAMPALQAAIEALEALNKKDISEIKSYGKPPYLVQKVMEAVMILRESEPTWAEAKKQLGEQDFIGQLVNFDKDNISDKTLKKISNYCAQDDFMPDVVGKVSFAAKSLCMWVRAMEVYGRVYRFVEPKRQRLQQAEAILREKQAQLAAAQAKLDAIMAEMARLQKEYNEKMEQKEELRRKAEELERMLERAKQLVDCLAGEKDRWVITVADLERRVGLLPGDCLVAAGFISYMGPFRTAYREELEKSWLELITKEKIPRSDPFSFTDFMVDPSQVRSWNLQGLPRDLFSVQNGVIVTTSSRWSLMIDPQAQALRWIKSMEGKDLSVIDLQMKNYMQILEQAVQYGRPVLLQNVQQTLDPGLDPVLNKSLMNIGGAMIMRLGDKEVEYNENFRFYLTTKLPNPHYTPEICTKTTIVNFAVVQQGLEAQLLGIVVRKEKPELEEQKDELVMGIANGKKKLVELEDEILRLLNETKGSLLEDVTLLSTLQTSKATSAEVSDFLAISEKTEVQIDAAREGYRPCAQRASILFFVLNDLGSVDPMYQFALDAYIDLFNLSIDKSQRSPRLEDRIANLNDYHTYAVYRYTCRGLFEKHKLLFSFQICIKILEAMGKLNNDEYMFFLRGGIVLDRENQMDNPASSWLTDMAWDNITELNKLPNYRGLVTSFEQYPKDWNIWYTADEPENAKLPGEWEGSTNEFQRMLIVRSLRPDRVSFCATTFIVNNMGTRFVEPPVLDMKQVVDDSSVRTPLIFVLSPGVDPTGGLLQLAEACGMGRRFNALSLGQGQAPIAQRLIQEGMRDGNWVFLANCHLSLSWMPQLDKLVELMGGDETHMEFRLWLSSSPTPSFPISILQAGIKMTTEPPKGLKANMKRLYHIVKEDQFSACTKPEKYKKLLFCICFFHSVLIERRKFGMLGWNVRYEFNDADFEVSENILTNYLDQYDDTPWDALRYLIADINYGGHVTDDWDRRLLSTYISDFFKEEALTEPFFKLSILPFYYIPRDGSLSAYREFVGMLPQTDHPEAFGQHPNADIASQIQETKLLFDTLLSLQPKVASSAGDSKEEKVLELIDNLSKQVPENLDYEGTAKIFANDKSPLVVVLLQEIQRYNNLLNLIRGQLQDLEKGIQGLVVMSSELDDSFEAIFENRVPTEWQNAYNSLRPLSSWARDLAQRIQMFLTWCQTAKPPKCFWIGAFTFPTGFLTAVMQTSARMHGISVDSLSWDFNVLTIAESNIPNPPKDGVYIRALYLEGAGWDMKNSNLIEAQPMMLVSSMPVIHFRPVENKKKVAKSVYVCPCYYYQNRSGAAGKPSFMIGVELKTGEFPPDHWIKRGTALIMSLDT